MIHSSILAWRIPWTEESGSYCHRVTSIQTLLKLLNTHASYIFKKDLRETPACRGTFADRRKAVRDRFALQGGTGDFP